MIKINYENINYSVFFYLCIYVMCMCDVIYSNIPTLYLIFLFKSFLHIFIYG